MKSFLDFIHRKTEEADEKDQFQLVLLGLLEALFPYELARQLTKQSTISPVTSAWIDASCKRWDSLVHQAFDDLESDGDQFKLIGSMAWLVGMWEDWLERKRESASYIGMTQAYLYRIVTDELMELCPFCYDRNDDAFSSEFAELQEAISQHLPEAKNGIAFPWLFKWGDKFHRTSYGDNEKQYANYNLSSTGKRKTYDPALLE